MTITLHQLSKRAKEGNWIITEDEAIDIWLLIPEGCNRMYTGRFIIKGLGEFEIK